ncbi:histone-like nucleoid-structuring protein Lsr2 [Sediminivirga luteola]|uniref:Lsr2 family protein n=1 Tax=Sediminivirga luteola TaxID=1774748 RepID=A0A8J2TXQ9_9MICO|nr:Lsr2 family protein [Sediminivirga luteola]MCI2266605.1 Lsr2 family protein [Sediminivirga luteola]GGA12708.1 Lsr2 family protein [Sediminivirga luteola]
MKKVITKKIDDLDGSPADETLQFMLDDNVYELDLTHVHADELRALIRRWTKYGRRVGGRRKTGTGTGSAQGDGHGQAVRAWARANGYAVRNRGRIPITVIHAYRKAEDSPRPAARS